MARIVIAGASRGIGLELARQAAARGDEVFATTREGDGDGLDARARVRTVRLDVSDPASCAAAAESIGGTLDLLVCNAGVFRGRGGLDDPAYTPDVWAETLATNIAGPFFVVRAFLPLMRRPGGRIAVISSRMGSSAESRGGGAYAYRASKAGAANLARNLALDLAPEGIAVGAWHPGWVRTDMGGSSATLSVEESAAALLDRFDALTLDRTGLFEDQAGTPIAF